MKKIRLLALLWVILIAWSLVGCTNNKESNNDTVAENNEWDFIIEDTTWENDAVISYNDNLVDIASKCVLSEDAIWEAYDETAAIEDVQIAINNTINECSSAREKINELWDWEWDSSLRDWVLTLIDKEIAYYSKFSELLPFSEKEELTEDEKAVYEELFTEVQSLDEELRKANENLTAIQDKFANNHWFELEDTEENIEENEVENKVENKVEEA